MLVFTRKTDDNLASLVKELDQLVTDKKDQKAFGVVNLLGEDAAALKKSAEELGAKHELKNTAIVVPVDHKTGPKHMKIHDDAETTVVFYNARKITATHAVKAGGLDKATVEKIVAEGKEALDKAPEKKAK